eukprot:2413215-Rhodomonas_salina.2
MPAHSQNVSNLCRRAFMPSLHRRSCWSTLTNARSSKKPVVWRLIPHAWEQPLPTSANNRRQTLRNKIKTEGDNELPCGIPRLSGMGAV